MLTSFFSTSKPATTITVLVYMTVGYFLANRSIFSGGFSIENIAQSVGIWILFILTMFILNFISQKNDLTKPSSYRILLFAVFATAIPQALQNSSIIISGVFVMLALRRILSFRSGLHMERKLFDAGFWICFAILTYFWTITFFGILVIGLMFYGGSILRYWFIPLLSIICVGTLTACYILYIGGDQSFILDVIDAISFDFSSYSEISVLLPIAVFITLYLWTVFSYWQELRKATISQRPLYRILLFVSLITFLIILLAPDKSGAEWYFFLIPLAIIMANYLENVKGKWFKEFLLWIVVIVPIARYFL